MIELDYILNRGGWMLLAISLLFCSLCVFLNLTYPGTNPQVLAVIVFAGGFLVSMTTMAGLRILKIS
jgi:hypothetical protein